MKQTVIVDACRTPVGKFGGSLAEENAISLGKNCLQELLRRVEKKIPPEKATEGENNLLKNKPYLKEVYLSKHGGEEGTISPSAAIIEEAIIGNVLSAGLGQNPARQIILPDLSRRVPAFTLNQVCASGMRSVIIADHLITSGVHKVMVAGGVESMSGAPYLFRERARKHRLGDFTMEDSIMRDGLSDALHGYPMGVTAENLARGWKISREEQDEFAYYSQKKAAEAETAGRFDAERMIYRGKKSRGETTLEKDEYIRHDIDLKKLGELKPVFAPSGEGTVTAGNSSGVNDGAALLYLMEAEQAYDWRIDPLATIVTSVTVAIDETVMGYTPKIIIEELLRRSTLSWQDIASVEINEAFAAQTLAVLKDLGVSPKDYKYGSSPTKVNPWGGAIALGHPIGCSGARIITTLAHTLHALKSQLPSPVYGIAALCVGGGQGCGILLKV